MLWQFTPFFQQFSSFFKILDNGVYIPLPLVSDRLTGIGDAVQDLQRATASNAVYVATNPFAAANCQLSQQII